VYERRNKADLENLYKKLNNGKYFKAKVWNSHSGELMKFAIVRSGTQEKISQKEDPVNGG